MNKDKIWIAKDAGANGADCIWVFGAANYDGVVEEMRAYTDALYVVQEYVSAPLLWNGRKMHFRCYAVVRGDMQCYMHRKAFLHAANKQFDSQVDLADREIHITNCCANKVRNSCCQPAAAGQQLPASGCQPAADCHNNNSGRASTVESHTGYYQPTTNHKPLTQRGWLTQANEGLFAGEICVDLVADYPETYASMKAVLADMVRVRCDCNPLMTSQ